MPKKVFFLGSGFSKALDKYPTLSELSEEIAEEMSGRDPAIRHYANEILSPLKNNVEHLLTYLSSDLPWKTDGQKHSDRALYSIIADKVASLFLRRAYSTLENAPKIHLKYKRLFDFFVTNIETIDFISLNYDLLLEILLQYSCHYLSKTPANDYKITSAKLYQFPMAWIGLRSMLTGMTFGDENIRTNPGIVKLHGSINWYWTGTSPSETIYYRNLLEDNADKNIDAGLIPYIIPPVMDKNAFYNHIMIKSLWQKARELLQNADEIYIIGFSFPQTDISVRFLFYAALEHKRPDIYVVNRVNEESKKDLIHNYSQIFIDQKVNYDFCKDEDVIMELGKYLENHNVK